VVLYATSDCPIRSALSSDAATKYPLRSTLSIDSTIRSELSSDNATDCPLCSPLLSSPLPVDSTSDYLVYRLSALRCLAILQPTIRSTLLYLLLLQATIQSTDCRYYNRLSTLL
jgi:hypothetical protein